MMLAGIFSLLKSLLPGNSENARNGACSRIFKAARLAFAFCGGAEIGRSGGAAGDRGGPRRARRGVDRHRTFRHRLERLWRGRVDRGAVRGRRPVLRPVAPGSASGGDAVRHRVPRRVFGARQHHQLSAADHCGPSRRRCACGRRPRAGIRLAGRDRLGGRASRAQSHAAVCLWQRPAGNRIADSAAGLARDAGNALCVLFRARRGNHRHARHLDAVSLDRRDRRLSFAACPPCAHTARARPGLCARAPASARGWTRISSRRQT